MKMFGIEFAPLNIPLHRRLETLSIAVLTLLFIGMPVVSLAVTIYVFFYTRLWWLTIIYIIWIILDQKTAETGGRVVKWVRSWSLFKQCRNYFPGNSKVVPGFKIDPKLNYLCGCFPHGFLPAGVLFGLTTGYGKEFENHTMYTMTVNMNFYMPIFRDFVLSMDMCKASPASLNYMLSYPHGGNVVLLPVGGSSEALYFKSGEYRIMLKNRKGFIKLALKNGSPVIPVFTFGENDLWKQVVFPDDSLIRRFQLWVRNKTNIAPVILFGRGFLQYTFGMIPFRKPINIVVGNPLVFGKIENPTEAEIDSAHQKFVEALVGIFEEYKYHYEANPEKCKLIIE